MVLRKSVVLLDIEGTTTSISFVKDELFPYIKNNLVSYLNKNWNTDELKLDIKLLTQQVAEDNENNIPDVVPIVEGGSDEDLKQSIVSNVLWQMSLDRKSKALKSLQGHIWTSGYEDGLLKGHIYEDVFPCLKKWKDAGLKLYIYSSGSVGAQKLLFGHTLYGDLLHLFSGYFDTNVGPKTEASSYQNILNEISCEPSQAVFLTDMIKEAKAAQDAGITPILVARDPPPNPSHDSTYLQVSTFDEVSIELFKSE